MDLHKAVRDPWVWGQIALIAGIVVGIPLLRAWLPGDSALAPLLRPAPPSGRLLALVPLLAGLVMAWWGARSLGPNLTPGTEPLAAGVLVERGAYRRVRHPLYLGIILLLWGAGWGLSNALTGVACGLLALVYFDRKAAAEERWLSRRFPEYLAYRSRVPKLIPRFRLRA
jgi:protein-S-isoprenylcysteine O-methyltransferase Ste14